MCEDGHASVLRGVAVCAGSAVVVGHRSMLLCILMLDLDDEELLWRRTESALIEPKPDCSGTYEEEVETYTNNENEKNVQRHWSGFL